MFVKSFLYWPLLALLDYPNCVFDFHSLSQTIIIIAMPSFHQLGFVVLSCIIFGLLKYVF